MLDFHVGDSRYRSAKCSGCHETFPSGYRPLYQETQDPVMGAVGRFYHPDCTPPDCTPPDTPLKTLESKIQPYSAPTWFSRRKEELLSTAIRVPIPCITYLQDLVCGPERLPHEYKAHQGGLLADAAMGVALIGLPSNPLEMTFLLGAGLALKAYSIVQLDRQCEAHVFWQEYLEKRNKSLNSD